MKITKGFLAILFILFIASLLLKSDIYYFLGWWFTYLLISIAFIPLTNKVFGKFCDKGYLFGKTLGVVIPAYVLWLLASFKIVAFSRISVIVCYLVIGAILFIYSKGYTSIIESFKDGRLYKTIVAEECMFTFCLAVWSFIRGLKPDISGKDGLEKFMDLGLVNSVLDSKYMPPADIWFAGKSINYYYFGHYITGFLTKLTGIPSSITYNLMMATLFALFFTLSFSLILNVSLLYKKDKLKNAVIAGLISASLLSLGGNLHTIMFTTVFPVIKSVGLLHPSITIRDSYWFPDATRYIGHNPDIKPPNEDKTIHEFPIYSLVVSDLHAHVINTQFVITVLALIFLLLHNLVERVNSGEILSFWGKLSKNFINERMDILEYKRKILKLLELLQKSPPELWIIAFLIGIFHMSNYWDFPIYTTVTLFALTYVAFLKYRDALNTSIYAALFIFIITVIGVNIAMPFSKNLTSLTNGIQLVKHSSKFYQLLIIWGYQLFFAVYFFRFIFVTERNYVLSIHASKIKRDKKAPPKTTENEESNKLLNKILVRLLRILEIPQSDVFILILSVSAIGLVMVPEIPLVRDIYGEGYARSNTMFKLTYQSFIMFALSAGYIATRVFSVKRSDFKHYFMRIAVVLAIILPMQYTYYVIPGWYGALSTDNYKGLDGVSLYFNNKLKSDYEAIKWMQAKNPDSQPVILEAYGDSYSDNGRFSVVTGFPTIMGWGTHEWLWRNSNNPGEQRRSEVDTVYESSDEILTRIILENYKVKYIVLGKIEREKFKNLKEDKLGRIGKLVFKNAETKVFEVEQKPSDNTTGQVN